jgi:hypothetical protein
LIYEYFYYFFIYLWGWSGTKSTVTADIYRAILSALDYYGAITGMKECQGKTPSEKTCPHDFTRARTRRLIA